MLCLIAAGPSHFSAHDLKVRLYNFFSSVRSKLSKYLSGFGNEFSSEALPGALPVGQVGVSHAAYAHPRQELPAAVPVRPLRRAALRHRVHRTTGQQPTHVCCQHLPQHLHAQHPHASHPSSLASWLYRIRPSAVHKPFSKVASPASLRHTHMIRLITLCGRAALTATIPTPTRHVSPPAPRLTLADAVESLRPPARRQGSRLCRGNLAIPQTQLFS